MNAYHRSFLHVKEFNCEQRVIVNDILCKKNKYSKRPLHISWQEEQGANIGNFFTWICIVQNMLQYCITKTIITNPLKLEIMKITYIGKRSFDINNSTIHYAHVINISLNPNQ